MFKRILVPVDGSPTANKALVAALQMARDCGGQVRLFHMVNEMAYLGGYDLYGGYSDELVRVLHEAGAKVISDAMAVAQAAGVPADNTLFKGFDQRLGDVVADAAKEWKADLVVVGSHGRRGIGRVLLGSGAEQVIRTAPVPVLVVRSGEKADKV